MRPRVARCLVHAALVLTVLHHLAHLAHLVRRDHIGWPASAEFNACSFGLLAYPLILGGLVLFRAGRAGPLYWVLVSGPGPLLLAAVHLGPTAVEPPRDVLEPYETNAVGVLALAVLMALLGVVAASFVYEVRAWRRERRAAHADRGAR